VSKRKSSGGYFADRPDLRWKVRIWKYTVPTWIVGLVVFMVVAAVAAKPAYMAFRGYRIDRNLVAAQDAAQAGDWGTARNRARNVLLVRREDLTAARIWTKALGKLEDRGAASAAFALFMDPRASREDRLETLQVLALQAPQAMAMQAFVNLPPDLRLDASFRAAITPLLIKQGALDIAEQQLRQVSTLQDPPAVRLELLRVLVSRPEVGRVAEAREIFASLIGEKADEAALAALLLLGDVPGALVKGPPLPDLSAWLDSQPRATPRHHLLGMQPALESEAGSADKVYQLAIKRFLETAPAELGTWLAGRGQGEQAAKILEESARTKPDAFLARLRILQNLRQEAALEEALANSPAGSDPIEIELARAALAISRNQNDLVDSALNKALDLAKADRSRNRFIEIAGLAGKYGASDTAERAWVEAVRAGWGPLPLYAELRPIVDSLMAKGRSEDLLALCEGLVRFERFNPELHLDFHYFALLHNVLPPKTVGEVVVKLKDRLETPECDRNLMLVHLMEGNAEAALAALPKEEDRGKGGAAMIAAMTGTARLINGETDEATRILNEVDWTALMPQEAIVLRGLLAKSRNSDPTIPDIAVPVPELDPEQTPAWRKAVEKAAADRANGNLPALPMPKVDSPPPESDEPAKDPPPP
jgi:hypothetical protein